MEGGVSDYTRLVASGLAAVGETVHVWCPSVEGKPPQASRVAVHQELRNIGPSDLHRVGRMLDRFARPRRLLIQWVPHAYGYKSMNLYFCWWLWQRAKVKRDEIEIM